MEPCSGSKKGRATSPGSSQCRCLLESLPEELPIVMASFLKPLCVLKLSSTSRSMQAVFKAGITEVKLSSPAQWVAREAMMARRGAGEAESEQEGDGEYGEGGREMAARAAALAGLSLRLQGVKRLELGAGSQVVMAIDLRASGWRLERLRTVELVDCMGLSTREMQAFLCRSLQHCLSLETLVLATVDDEDDSPINEDGVVPALASQLAAGAWPKLQHLGLDKVDMGMDGLRSLASALETRGKLTRGEASEARCVGLKSLRVGPSDSLDSTALGQVVRSACCATLEVLEVHFGCAQFTGYNYDDGIDDNIYDDEGSQEMIEARQSAMRDLFVALGEGVCSCLRELHLTARVDDECRVLMVWAESADLEALDRAITARSQLQCRPLEVLDMSLWRVGRASLASLFASPSCRMLKEVRLDAGGLNRDSIDGLAAGMRQGGISCLTTLVVNSMYSLPMAALLEVLLLEGIAPRLSHLELWGADIRGLPAEVLGAGIETGAWAELTELRLSNCEWIARQWVQLMRSASPARSHGFAKLKTLHMHGSPGISREQVAGEITTAIRSGAFPRLQELRMEAYTRFEEGVSCDRASDLMRAVVDGLMGGAACCSSITCLSFLRLHTDCIIVSLAGLLTSGCCPHLSALELHNLDDVALDGLCSALRLSPYGARLKSISIQGTSGGGPHVFTTAGLLILMETAIQVLPSLQELDLSYQYMPDEYAEIIARAIPSLPCLQTLRLLYNRFSEEGQRRVLDALESLPDGVHRRFRDKYIFSVYRRGLKL